VTILTMKKNLEIDFTGTMAIALYMKLE